MNYKKAYFGLTFCVIMCYASLLGVKTPFNQRQALMTSERHDLTKSKAQDLEIKDAQLIFSAAWNDLVQEVGRDNLRFPKEIFWLNGAPGAGKGTHTAFIMEKRDFTPPPIVMSDLLQSEEARKRKDAGLLVGDSEVLSMLLKQLLDPKYKDGVIVDGFPRTFVQVECLKLFYNKLIELRAKDLETKGDSQFLRPNFHILVLYVDEEVSVKRQMSRGQQALENNKRLAGDVLGQEEEVRVTDLDEEKARTRYRTFKEVTYDSLRSLKEVFHYHLIDAQGTIDEVQDHIIEELQYQSSLELNQETFDRVNSIPLATEVVKHARQQLVQRLEDYEEKHKDLFSKVVAFIQEKFVPVIQRHALSGQAKINTEDPLFHEPLALAMAVDICSERGYRASVDVRRKEIPLEIDANNKVLTQIKRVYRFQLKFTPSIIPRGRL